MRCQKSSHGSVGARTAAGTCAVLEKLNVGFLQDVRTDKFLVLFICSHHAWGPHLARTHLTDTQRCCEGSQPCKTSSPSKA